MQQRVQTKFTEALDYLNDGLTKPRRMKKYDKVLEKVGSLKSDYASIAKYYTVDVKKEIDFDEEEIEDTYDKLQELKQKVEQQLGINNEINQDELKYEVLLEKVTLMTEEAPEDIAALLEALLSEENQNMIGNMMGNNK